MSNNDTHNDATPLQRAHLCKAVESFPLLIILKVDCLVGLFDLCQHLQHNVVSITCGEQSKRIQRCSPAASAFRIRGAGQSWQACSSRSGARLHLTAGTAHAPTRHSHTYRRQSESGLPDALRASPSSWHSLRDGRVVSQRYRRARHNSEKSTSTTPRHAHPG